MNPPVSKLPTALAHLAVERSFGPGEAVFRMGAAARHVHFLAQGRVTLSRFGPQGEEVAITRHARENSLQRPRCTASAITAPP